MTMEVKLLPEENGVVRLESFGSMSAAHPNGNPLEDLCGAEVYARRVLLSLRGCQYLDSTGVGWLLGCHKRFLAAGGKLVLHSPSPVLLQILKMMRMHLALNLADDEVGGRALLNGGPDGH